MNGQLYVELSDGMREYRVAVLSWEVPNKSEITTGAGRFSSYLAELGKFSRKRYTRIDLTFIVPWQKDGVVRGNGYKIFFLRTPGFSNDSRYDEDVLYPSCKSFANKLLCGQRQIDPKKFDLVLATSFIFGGLISRIQHLDNIVYISHRPEFLREKLAEKFNVTIGNRRRLHKDAKLESKAVRCSRCTVTVSEACRREISKRYGRNKIHVIPNGVDTNLFSRIKVPPQGGKTVLTYVGRNHPEKGVSILLKSVKTMKSRSLGRNFELRLITDNRVGLQQTVKKLGLQNYVKLMKWKKQWQLPRHYSASTFTIMPSYWESFSYVVAESLSCETPVIASTAGALPEIVSPNTGLFFRKGNEADLADKLLTACSLPHKCSEEMGRKGRQKIQCSFSKERFLKNYLKFIEESVNGTFSNSSLDEN